MPRPYPWRCRDCGEVTLAPVTVDYKADMEHDGVSYSFTVPSLEVLECASCKSRALPDEAFSKVMNKLRSEAQLLTPEQIKFGRTELAKLTQEQLASYLKIARETVSRWESGGQIQTRAYDTLLRLFFKLKTVREALGHKEPEQSSMDLEFVGDIATSGAIKVVPKEFLIRGGKIVERGQSITGKESLRNKYIPATKRIKLGRKANRFALSILSASGGATKTEELKVLLNTK